MVDALEIGFAIKERRAQLGLTQAQVAEAAHVSKRCLWSLELGQNPGVQLDKLTAVLAVLGLELTLGPGGSQANPRPEPIPEECFVEPALAYDDSGALAALAILTGGKQ